MSFSRTTIKELTKRYSTILKKCALLNAAILLGAFFNCSPAQAAVVTNYAELLKELQKNGETVTVKSGTKILPVAPVQTDKITLNSRLENYGTVGIKDEVEFEKASSTVKTGNVFGGAIYNGTTLTFNDAATLTDNYIVAAEGAAYGGAISNNSTSSSITFNDTATFIGNYAISDNNGRAGAIHNSGTVTFNGAATFTDNYSTGGNYSNGGAIYSYRGALTFNDVATFTGNHTNSGGEAWGGAILNNGNSNTTFNDAATFTGNYATGDMYVYGGAIFSWGGTVSFNDAATFTGNYATSDISAYGGVIYNYGTFTFADTAVFTGNYVMGGTKAYGGAIGNVGIITFNDTAVFTGNHVTGGVNESKGGAIYNNGTFSFDKAVIFADNHATSDSNAQGGAIYNSGALGFNDTATFIGNYAPSDSNAQGGAIFNDGADATVSLNNAFTFGDNAATIGRDIYNGGTIDLGTADTTADVVGSFAGGVAGAGAINKNGLGTVIFGDKSVNDEFTGTYTQNGGTTIMSTETGAMLGGTNIINDGTLKMHGSAIAYGITLSDTAQFAHYSTTADKIDIDAGDFTTGKNFHFGGYTKAVQDAEKTLVADIQYTDADGNTKIYKTADNLFTAATVDKAHYSLGTKLDVAGNNISFSDSNITLTETDYVNAAYTFGGENTLHISDEAKPLTFTDVTIDNNALLDIGTIKVKTTSLKVKDNATLKVTLNNSSSFGALQTGSLTAGENAKVHFNFGSDFEQGTYNIFGIDATALAVADSLYNVTVHDNGSYTFEMPSAEQLGERLGATDNQGNVIEGVLEGQGENEGFNRFRARLMDELQSGDAGRVDAALKAANAFGHNVNPVVQSFSVEQLGQITAGVAEHAVTNTGESLGRSGGDCDAARANMWVKGFYDHTRYSRETSVHGKTRGVAIGVQSRVTDDVTVGLGYSYALGLSKDEYRRTEADSHMGFGYIKYQPSNWFVMGQAGYGRSAYEEDKQVFMQQGRAEYDVDTLSAQMAVGYDIGYKGALITPHVGARYLRVMQDGYTDSFGTTTKDATYTYVTGMAGVDVRGKYLLTRKVSVTPKAGVVFGYDIGRDESKSTSVLSNGANYVLDGNGLPRFSTTVKAGLDLSICRKVSASVDYVGVFRKDYQGHGGMLRLKYNF